MKRELILLLFISPLVFGYVFSDHMKRSKPKQNRELTLLDSFQKLQGSQTRRWGYIHTEKDYQALGVYEALYNKNKKAQFNSAPTFKIPKTIHLIWLGPQPFPAKSIENIRSWMAYHPDWTFKLWTDRKRPPPCRGMQIELLDHFEFQFLKEKYEASDSWREKAAIWRYEILYAEGGLYIDDDVKCFRPFHGLHAGYDLFAGLEMPHERIDGLALSAGNAVIGVRAHHPVIKGAIETILARWEEVSGKFSSIDLFTQGKQTAHRTFTALTHAFEKHLNYPENTDIVFPACYFFPEETLPGFYSRHFCRSSSQHLERTESEKVFLQTFHILQKRDAKILRIELFSFIALFGCFTLYFLINRETKK